MLPVLPPVPYVFPQPRAPCPRIPWPPQPKPTAQPAHAGPPQVADFGACNPSSVWEGAAAAAACIQNPRWLAPERLAGGAGGMPSDVWAFGTVMHELLTWEVPHGDLNDCQVGGASGQRWLKFVAQASVQSIGAAPNASKRAAWGASPWRNLDHILALSPNKQWAA